MKTKYRWLRYGLGVTAVSVLVVGCGTAGGTTGTNGGGSAGGNSAQNTAGGSTSAKKYTITLQLQTNTGAPDSKENKALVDLTKKYEQTHPNVTVKYLPNSFNSITQANAVLLTQASGGKAPDIVWEQYGPADAGTLPKGLLLNLKPYLNAPDPYAGGKTWISTWQSSVIPYMQAADGNEYVLLGSSVATEIVYNKQEFQKAGITSTPKTFADFLTDMKKLKAAGIQPFMLGMGTAAGSPSWFERKFSSELLHAELSKFNVNHAAVAAGLDTAVGIKKGIISMNNPAYAEGWKLLGDMLPYLAPGESTYAPTSPPTASSPPLSTEQPFIQGKYAMFYGGSWNIPQLISLGMKSSQFGFFSFPEITTATTKYSSNISVKGVVGGPNGTGEWSVTTQKADSTMTPGKEKQVIDYLEYLYAPQNEGQWVQAQGGGAYIPLIKGATYSGVSGIQSLVPTTTPPTTVEGILSGALTNKASSDGLRLLQNYVGGGISFAQFSKQWDQILQQGATDWAKTNNVNLSKY